MNAARVRVLSVVSGVLLASCTTATGHTSTRSGFASPAAGVTPLTPSVPGVFTTGTNACGDPYAINATTRAGTVPLVDCPGWAGLNPTPHVELAVGGELTIAGLPATATLTALPANLLRAYGTSYVAVGPGTTIFTIHGFGCVPRDGGTQPSTCLLLRVRTG